MKNIIKNNRLVGTGLVLAALAIAAGATFLSGRGGSAQAETATAAPAALPVSVSVVAPRQTVPWDEFSGRLEAVERVDMRSRVAGAIQAVHFRGGRAGETGRPADHDRSGAVCGRGGARRRRRWPPPGAPDPHQERFRARRSSLTDSRTISQRDLDDRVNAHREADANLQRGRGRRCRRQDSISATPQMRAPVSGRRRQARDHGRQSGRRRPGRAGADHAGLGQSDLCQLQCRRTGGAARLRTLRG